MGNDNLWDWGLFGGRWKYFRIRYWWWLCNFVNVQKKPTEFYGELNHNMNNKVVTKKKKKKDRFSCQLECALTVDREMRGAVRGVQLSGALPINQINQLPSLSCAWL